MAQHTPGPWRYQASSFCATEFVLTGSDGDGGAVLPVLGRVCNWPKNAEANARLISAAPEMLKVLRELDAWWADAFPHGPDAKDKSVWGGVGKLSEDTLEIWKNIRAAIAKAEGR